MIIFVAMAMVMVRMGLGMYVAGSVLCTTKSHVRKKTGSNGQRYIQLGNDRDG
jgi:hypothetical protein